MTIQSSCVSVRRGDGGAGDFMGPALQIQGRLVAFDLSSDATHCAPIRFRVERDDRLIIRGAFNGFGGIYMWHAAETFPWGNYRVFMELLPIGVEVHLNFHYSLAARPDGRTL